MCRNALWMKMAVTQKVQVVPFKDCRCCPKAATLWWLSSLQTFCTQSSWYTVTPMIGALNNLSFCVPAGSGSSTPMQSDRRPLWVALQKLCTFLGMFAKLRKATISFVMSICPLVCLSVHMDQLSSHWTDFHETWFFFNISRKFKFH